MALNPLIARTFLDADEIGVLSEFIDNFWLDILACPTGDVVDDGRAAIQPPHEMVQDALLARLAVIRVDYQRPVHASRKARVCGLHLSLRVVGAGISNDHQFTSPGVDCMLNQGGALLAGHKVALASRAADHEALHAVFNLMLDVLVECFDVDLAALGVGRLNGGDQLGLFHFFQVLRLCNTLLA